MLDQLSQLMLMNKLRPGGAPFAPMDSPANPIPAAMPVPAQAAGPVQTAGGPPVIPAPQPQEPQTAPQAQQSQGGADDPEYFRKQRLKWEAENASPDKSQFNPSIGRRILAGVIGGFAGIHDPRTGAQLAENVVNAPYTKAKETYDAKLARISGLADEEGKQEKDKAANKLHTAQTENQTAEAKERTAKSRKEEFDISPAGVEAAIKLNLSKHAPPQPKMGTFEDTKTGKKFMGTATVDENGGLRVIDAQGRLMTGDSIVEVTKETANAPFNLANEFAKAKIDEWKIAHPNQPVTAQVLGDVMHAIPQLKELDDTAQQRAAQIIRIETGTANAANTRSNVQKHVQDIVDAAIQQKDPQLIYTLKKAADIYEAQGLYREKTGKIPEKLTPKDADLIRRSRKSLESVKSLESLLASPIGQQMVGPVMGNWNKFGEWLGRTPGLTDQERIIAQEIRSKLDQVTSTEMQAVSNSPLRVQLLNALTGVRGDIKMAPAHLKGWMNAIKSNASENFRIHDQAQFGDAPGQMSIDDVKNYFKSGKK